MSVIQIRNVPTELHRQLKARAARAGMSLSDYVLRGIQQTENQPTIEEMLARLESRSPVAISESTADLVRAERDDRDDRY
jgi:plasmid stability protein